VTLIVKGLDELKALMAKGAGPIPVEVLASTLRTESLYAFRNSQRVTPHANGVLRASGVVNPPVVEGTHVEVQMGYGGAASAYALKQHEDLTLHHPDPRNPHSDPSGQAKYLETPVRDQVQGLAGRLRAALESRIR
jgi:hypothetical protein